MIQTVRISTMFKHRDKSLIGLGLKAAEKIINFCRKRDNTGKPQNCRKNLTLLLPSIL
jgi:hypothetical protein